MVNQDGTKTGNFKGECNFCKEVCGYRIRDCPAKKAQDTKSGGGGGSRGSAKVCNFCGKRGHGEDGCWKKNPDKAPDWLKEKWAKSGGGKRLGMSRSVSQRQRTHIFNKPVAKSATASGNTLC